MPFDTTRKVTVNSTQVGGYEMRQGITLDYGVDEALANSYKTIEKTYADITSRERKAQLLTNSSGSPIQAHVNGQFSYVSYIDQNMVIIEGEKYEISYEPLGDSFARYVSFIINNGAVKVSETTLLEGELTVYGENGNDVTYHLSDYSDGFEIKAYIKSDNSFQCKTNVRCYTLAKQVYDGAPSLAAANQSPVPESWYRQRWYYRVDNNTVQQILNGYWTSGKTQYTPRENYIDSESFGLNSIYGYTYPTTNETLKQAFGLDEGENITLVSFADMYVALTDDESKTVLDGCYNSNTVKMIRDVLTNSNGGYKIQNIKCNGHASKQARNASTKVNTRRNTSLAQERANTLMSWFKSAAKIGQDVPTVASTIEIEPGGDLGKKISDNNINLEETKAWRSAALVIEYTQEDIENAVATQETSQTKEAVQSTNGNKKNIWDLDEALVNNLNKELRNIPFVQEQRKATIDALNTLDGEFDNSFINQYTNLYKNSITVNDVPRYDNEGEFFKLLSKEDPLAMSAISEKVKYFDPAFHSISPEGFNARLTFLHQCTRQGPTVGTSDMNVMTANNLAFGRPPVCVLRIGDFYYTKILINSVSIEYEQNWDLNQEGIGVMPMMANVNISFVFLGGSDIEGPIARLQNAVSFNYYANTSIYDNRADKVKYDPSGNGREIDYKAFLYPLRSGNVDNQEPGSGTTI